MLGNQGDSKREDDHVPPESQTIAPLAESPWFWVLLFSAAAIAALFAMDPKYGRRQLQLDRQYLARERAADPTFGPSPSSNNTEVAPDREDTRISLFPLRAVALAAVILSFSMLLRQRLNIRT